MKDSVPEVSVGDSGTIGRREFTLQSALAGATITISGCVDANPAAPSGASSAGTISGNHGHSAVITSAALTARDAISLNIAGSAGHPHTVELSTAEVGQIADGMQVTKTSSTDDFHSHNVTFN